MLAVHALDRPVGSDRDRVTVSGLPSFDAWTAVGLPTAVMDPDLKLLVRWCLALEQKDRPPLQTVLYLCENAVATRDEAYYEANPITGSVETDVRCEAFLRDLIFDPIISDDEADIF